VNQCGICKKALCEHLTDRFRFYDEVFQKANALLAKLGDPADEENRYIASEMRDLDLALWALAGHAPEFKRECLNWEALVDFAQKWSSTSADYPVCAYCDVQIGCEEDPESEVPIRVTRGSDLATQELAFHRACAARVIPGFPPV
jgi:hypothetical protein